MERLSVYLYIIPTFFTLKVLIRYSRSANVEGSFSFKVANV